MARAFVLRALDALDVDVAAELHRDAFVAMGERAWTRLEFAELLASDGATGFLVSAAGEPLGFALMRVTVDEAELLTLAVAARHRRRGAGRSLLEAVVGESRKRGARALFLEVGADNAAARVLYDRAGFRVVGRRGGYYRRGEGSPADAIVMQLTLN
jgi:[ribosomal protein S18]-alanine N-acetyltransferase